MILVIIMYGAFLLILWQVSPPCIIAETTGFLCPGCGGTRAVKSVLQGDFIRALQCNLLLPFFLLIILIQIVLCALKRYNKSIELLENHALNCRVILGITIAFTVLRNFPFSIFDFLRPPL